MKSLVILAGGLALRMRHLTGDMPKSLLEVAGRPFICWQLEYIYTQGIRNVVICLGYLGGQIRDFIGDGEKFGLSIIYAEDLPSQLGTGGAILNALDLIPGQDFFVMYGDSYLPIQFKVVQDFYDAKRINALMTIYRNVNEFDLSNVMLLDNDKVRYKKNSEGYGSYIDYGLLILSKNNFKNLKLVGKLDLAEILHRISLENKLYGYEVFNRFYEIGSPSGLLMMDSYMKQFFLEGGNELHR
jgi:NDP-sugar pyrophosphorylase family protein